MKLYNPRNIVLTHSRLKKKYLKCHPILPTPLTPPTYQLTGKHFHSYQLGLVALAHSGVGLDLLKQELNAPTTFMKQFLANHVVANERKYVQLHFAWLITNTTCSDVTLIALLTNSVASTRKLLLHACLVEKRTAVIDTVFPLFHKEHGTDLAASVLHGCSRATIIKNLATKEFFTAKQVHVKHLVQYVVVQRSTSL